MKRKRLTVDDVYGIINTSGIYQIISKTHSERVYIGSACNMRSRKNMHMSELKKGKHGNSKLQRHYNKYGEGDLVFNTLCCCEKESLIEMEQFYIDSKKTWFNICKIAGSSLGVKRRPLTEKEREAKRICSTGRKHSKESIELLKISLLKGVKERGANISKALMGRKLPQETIDKIKETSKGRVPSRESMAKASITKTGKKMPQEIKEKLSQLMEQRTEEEITTVNAKISESCKKAWIKRKLNSIQNEEETTNNG